MCGIAGFTWEDSELISNMTAALAHRGPDSHGERVADGVSLGHSRLAIIDLSPKGNQPMCNEDKTLWVVVNGEIYNHQDLRAELIKAGHVFYSNSDSESVLHAYEQWGEGFISRLTGMFCFALFDSRRKRVILGRDRLGIKPLYYHHDGRALIFANEIKAILQWPRFPRRVNPQALFHYLGYEFTPAPLTLFEGVNKLRQGHYAVFDMETGSLAEKPYWDLAFEPAYQRPEEAVEDLRAMMRLAVKRRLMSDVPLGVFLSGGLDSTTVVALMRELGVDPLRTFTIGYHDKGFGEQDQAEFSAKYFGTDHTVLMIEDLTMEELEKAVYHLDEPMTDLSAIPLMLICREARKQVTVVLSGEGGDEVFCGYDRFKASRAAQVFDYLPGAAQIAHKLAGLLKDQPQKKGAVNVLKRFLDGAVLPKAGQHLRWQYFLLPGQADSIFKREMLDHLDTRAFAPVANILAGCNSKKRLDREIYADLKLTMADSVLMKVDKMSMSTSLEVRVPFLDHELVELTAKLPGWFKLKGFTTKYILREAIRGLAPDQVVDRGKQGYSLPVKNLLRDQLRPVMEELLRESALVKQFCQAPTIERLMKEHLSGAHNHNHVLWALMNAALWHRRFLEG